MIKLSHKVFEMAKRKDHGESPDEQEAFDESSSAESGSDDVSFSSNCRTVA